MSEKVFLVAIDRGDERIVIGGAWPDKKSAQHWGGGVVDQYVPIVLEVDLSDITITGGEEVG